MKLMEVSKNFEATEENENKIFAHLFKVVWKYIYLWIVRNISTLKLKNIGYFFIISEDI